MEKKEPSYTISENVNWKSHYRGSLETKHRTRYDTAIPLLDIYPEKTLSQKDTCTPMFIKALFTITRTWKHLNVHQQLCCVAQLCLTLCKAIDWPPPDSSVFGDSPGKDTEVGCHALLHGIFPTQGSNPGLPHCRQILCHLRETSINRGMDKEDMVHIYNGILCRVIF